MKARLAGFAQDQAALLRSVHARFLEARGLTEGQPGASFADFKRTAGAYYTSGDVSAYIASRAIVPAVAALLSQALGISPPFDMEAIVTAGGSVQGALLAWFETFDARQSSAALHELQAVRVLDPTCGAGAFLESALDVLEPLYASLLSRTGGWQGAKPQRAHIAANNLYGVDLMPEAVEWCKLRVPGAHIFSGDILHGGTVPGVAFDAVIGNPPYVERGGSNLYAQVTERSVQLLAPHGMLGFIIPHSAFCTDRMTPLMDLLRPSGGWISFYDIRPGRLFDGVDQRLAIVLWPRAGARSLYTTGYRRWKSQDRDALFDSLRYTPSVRDYPGSVPKFGCALDSLIFERIRNAAPMRDVLHGDRRVFFHNAPRYWVRATTFEPRHSSHVRALAAPDAPAQKAVCAALNSSLFYWWFILLSNCRDLGLREIERFPLAYESWPAGVRDGIAALADDLMRSYRENAVRKTARYRTGTIEYDEYAPKKSKAIIDAIDNRLCAVLGLSAEEAAYIKAFDGQFRM